MAFTGQGFISSLKKPPLKVVIILVVVLYLILRFAFMMRFPIFNDEALTIRYGKISVETPYTFYTLAVGGKQPLLYWVDGLMTHILPDPLIAGRVVSLFFGLGTLAGVYALTRRIGDATDGWNGMLLYAVAPLHILYDGMAIHDAAITFLYTWILFCLLSLVQRFSILPVVLIGVMIGTGLWIKTTAFLFLIVATGVLGVFVLRRKISVAQAIIAYGIWALLFVIMLLPLVLRPEFAGLVRMQNQYALTVNDIVGLPVDIWYANFRDMLLVYLGFLTPLALLAPVMAFVRSDNKIPVRLVALVFIATVILLVFTGKSMHSRYMVFTAVPLIVLLAHYRRRLRFMYFVMVGAMSILALLLSFKPETFFHLFPRKHVFAFEAFQYVDGWPSGYGVMEALMYVDRHRSGKPAFVGVRWDAGNPEDTILLYAPKLSNIASGFLDPRLPDYDAMREELKGYPVYLITRDNQRASMDDHLTLLARFDKPSGVEAVEVYSFSYDKVNK